MFTWDKCVPWGYRGQATTASDSEKEKSPEERGLGAFLD
jgi:hypothetical protein